MDQAMRGPYSRHIEKCKKRNPDSGINPSADPEMTMSYLQTDIDVMLGRHPKIGTIITGLYPPYKKGISERIYIAFRMVKLSIDEIKANINTDSIDAKYLNAARSIVEEYNDKLSKEVMSVIKSI